MPTSDNVQYVKSEHIALARSRTWNAADPWQFIAYCRLMLGLPEDGPAPYYLIDQAISPPSQPNHNSIVLKANESLSAANVKPYNGTDYTIPDPSCPATPTADHTPTSDLYTGHVENWDEEI